MILIGGPTASGKSGLAVEVAKRLNGEVISADSMQIYRDLDVGTAKITRTEMDGVPHHLIDIVDADEPFSLAKFTELAKNCSQDIVTRKKTPIVCGGTGLYMSALIYDYSMSAYDESLRTELKEQLKTEGIDVLYERLLSLDPKAIDIDKRNEKRVLRALEVVLAEGKSILDKTDKQSYIPHLLYAIDVPRELLYKRINDRVDRMFREGLTEEITRIKERYGIGCFDYQSMQAIGYKEFRTYFSGEQDLDEIKELIKQHTRNYAKRQLTWFRRMDTCKWLDFNENERNIEIIANDFYNFINKIE
ncbi:MAG: tRNA (adenosine(37)-N6)-dimethylallyltransferase MiaA [Clostridia bacterium]|nr:tRNA (adenosine(37)-N6)-dimethylallyltransferase MiaA [Clostridia bacterium]